MLGYAMLMKAIGLVVVSFFVLLGASKADSSKLQKFGRILAFTLWLLAICSVVSALFSTLAEAKYEKYMISPKYKTSKRMYKQHFKMQPYQKMHQR